MARGYAVGSLKMEIFPVDAADRTDVITVNAQNSTSITGSFAKNAAFTLAQTDNSLRSAIKDYYIDVDTAPITQNYEDGTKDEIYQGATTARNNDKVIKYIWYSSQITGGDGDSSVSGNIIVIQGYGIISGDSGNLDTSAGALAASPVNIVPVPALAADIDFTGLYDTTVVTDTAATTSVTAGDSSLEQYLPVAT